MFTSSHTPSIIVLQPVIYFFFFFLVSNFISVKWRLLSVNSEGAATFKKPAGDAEEEKD